MNKTLLKIFITLLLILAVLFLIGFNSSYFFGVPTVLDRLEDQDALVKMQSQSQRTGCALITRFADDKVYYVASCDNEYVFYDINGNLFEVRALSSLNLAKLISLYSTSYEFADEDVSLGYYHKRPIYVIDNEELELLIDYDNFDILRYYQKG